jgi:hypothetical protein
MTPDRSIRLLTRPLMALGLVAAVTAVLTACGGPPQKVDTESIRRNADDADRDLDRESDKHKED